MSTAAALESAPATSTTAGPSSAGALFARPCFIYTKVAALQIAAVQRGNGFLPFAIVGHLHEPKPSGPSGVTIGNDVYAVYPFRTPRT